MDDEMGKRKEWFDWEADTLESECYSEEKEDNNYERGGQREIE